MAKKKMTTEQRLADLDKRLKLREEVHLKPLVKHLMDISIGLNAMSKEYLAFSKEAKNRIMNLEALIYEMAHAVMVDKAEIGSPISKTMLKVMKEIREEAAEKK
jgi:hypothetical protein